MLTNLLPNALQSLRQQLDVASRALEQREPNQRVMVAATKASLFSPDSQFGMFAVRETKDRSEVPAWQVWGNNLMIAPELRSLVICHYDPRMALYAPITPDDLLAGLLAETNLKRLTREGLDKLLEDRVIKPLRVYDTD